MRNLSAWIAATTLALALSAAAPAGDPPPDAKAAFLAIQAVCKRADAAALEKALPAAIGETVIGKDAAKIAEWRKGLAALLAKSTLGEVREDRGIAVLHVSVEGGTEVELLFSNAGGAWGLLSPVAYQVKGKELDGANGKGPAALRLTARSTGGPYGTSAISFAHVTQDPRQCLDRMDLWYCHNGDFHMCATGKIARVAAKDLASVKGIPTGVSWKDELAPETGGTYVLQCRKMGHRDFFVKVRAKTVDARKVDLEWALLGAGFGSPASIHAPQPIVSRDGEDGFDALCGKNAERSKPEPAPAAAGTATGK